MADQGSAERDCWASEACTPEKGGYYHLRTNVHESHPTGPASCSGAIRKRVSGSDRMGSPVGTRSIAEARAVHRHTRR